MEGYSLSKKYRLAVKENLFDGSFKEFASLYNSEFAINDNAKEEDEHFSDDATKFGASKAPSDTTAADLRPIDKANMEQPRIMGMTKPTFILVAGGFTVLTVAGIYLLTKNLSKKKE